MCLNIFPEKENLKLFLQNSSELITLLDVDGTILYESPAVSKILGYSEKELIGRNVFELCHPLDKELAVHYFKNLLQNNVYKAAIELRLRHKDGHFCYLESNGKNLLKNKDFQCLVVNSKDITAQKKLEQKLHSKIFELDTFIYRISHDLRGPTSSIEGLIHLIESQPDDTEFNEIISKLHFTSKVLQTRISDIEKVANISRNSIEKKGLDIRSVIENTIYRFKHEFAAPGLIAAVQARSANKIALSAMLIEEIIYNLLKFSFNSVDQRSVETVIQISIKESSHTISIIYTDKQLFIPFSDRESIFNIFNSKKLKNRGSGIELYIVKKAVEKLFGKINITSRITAGSGFTVTFPYSS